jgi:hypothetical protein
MRHTKGGLRFSFGGKAMIFREYVNKENIYRLWSRFSQFITIIASLTAIYSWLWPGDAKDVIVRLLNTIEKSQQDLEGIRDSVDLLAESVPYWIDMEIIASATTPTALHPDIEGKSVITVRINNDTNFPVRIVEIRALNQLGSFSMEENAFVVTARGYKGVQFPADLHRQTTICVVGSLQNGASFKEVRDLEFSPPGKDDAFLFMGLAMFDTTVLDQKLSAAEYLQRC